MSTIRGCPYRTLRALLFVLVLSTIHSGLVSGGSARAPTARRPPPRHSPPLKKPSTPRVDINILHVNDVHNRFEAATSSAAHCPRDQDEAGACFGGYARIAAAVQQERKRDPQTLFLDAGDQFLGTPWDVIYRGNMTAQFQNMLKPDAMVLGNHEFDYGSNMTATYVRSLAFPMLGACNLDLSNSEFLKGRLRKYLVKIIKGKKVAIVGVVTPDTMFTSNPDDNERFIDPIIGLNGCMQEMYREHGKSIDAVVVLSHGGYQMDLNIAAQVPGVDLVIGGHSHFLLWTGPTPLKKASDPKSNDTFVTSTYPTYVTSTYNTARQVPVVTAWTASRYLGKLVLSVGGDRASSVRGLPILLGGNQSTNNVPRDPVVDKAIRAYAGPVDAFTLEIVGATTVPLDHTQSRVTEANIGDLVCDAMLEWMHVKTKLGRADLCLYNAGNIRASIPVGNISMGDLTSVLPFGNQIAIIRIQGSDLIQAIHNGVSAVGYTSSTGRFLQVAGLRYVFDASRTTPANQNDPGLFKDRLLYAKLLINGTESDIDPCATYTVVTSDYLASGGDNYMMLTNGEMLLPNGDRIEYVLADYLQQASPVSTQVDGRVINCQMESHPACTNAVPVPDTCGTRAARVMRMPSERAQARARMLAQAARAQVSVPFVAEAY